MEVYTASSKGGEDNSDSDNALHGRTNILCDKIAIIDKGKI